MKKLSASLSKIIASLLLVTSLSSCSLFCDHQWSSATCASAKTCILCGASEGGLGDHQYENATCDSPKHCKLCHVTEGNSLEHVAGEWTLVENATLIRKGKEIKTCSLCNKELETRSIELKRPDANSDGFNFTDKELIDFINDNTTTSVSNTNLEIADDSSVTSYKITMPDDTKGALFLTHSGNNKNGNVNGIMIYFYNTDLSISMTSWLGHLIDSDFDSAAAASAIETGVYDSGKITMLKGTVKGDFITVVSLTPSASSAD